MLFLKYLNFFNIYLLKISITGAGVGKGIFLSLLFLEKSLNFENINLFFIYDILKFWDKIFLFSRLYYVFFFKV